MCYIGVRRAQTNTHLPGVRTTVTATTIRDVGGGYRMKDRTGGEERVRHLGATATAAAAAADLSARASLVAVGVGNPDGGGGGTDDG